MGHYAQIFFVLGLVERLDDLVDIRNDARGLELEAERLPQPIRRPRKTRQRRETAGKP